MYTFETPSCALLFVGIPPLVHLVHLVHRKMHYSAPVVLFSLLISYYSLSLIYGVQGVQGVLSLLYQRFIFLSRCTEGVPKVYKHEESSPLGGSY